MFRIELMRRPNALLSSVVSCLCLFLVQPAVGEIPRHDRVRILSDPQIVSGFELTDRRGQAFRLNDLGETSAMVFFGFTNCPDVCPMTMQTLKRFKFEAGSALDDVAVVMISVDGDRDTPERMNAFLDRYSENFVGLTGDPAVVKTIAKEFSAAFFKEAGGNGDQDYSVSHSPQVFLLDRSGRLRAEFYNASVDAMIDVVLAVENESSIE